MEYKVIKFKDSLAKLILQGKKDVTWRLYDDKDLKKGDVISFQNSETREVFGTALLIDVWEKKMGELQDSDLQGHEKYSSEEAMYATFRTYYGDKVGPDTNIKIIRFKLL